MMLDAFDVRRRGWTEHLLRHHAPPADDYVPNRVGYMNPLRLWRRETIIRAERRAKFQMSLRRSLRRRRLDRVAALIPGPGFMLGAADLERRGWDADLIRTFAPAPDGHGSAAGGTTEPRWTPEAIVGAEARPEFQKALLRALWVRPRTDVPALRCTLTVERVTAGLDKRQPTPITIGDMAAESEASLLYLGNRHDWGEALAEYNRRRRDRGRLTLDAFHALCRPSMPTPDIITENHRRATDRALRTLWQVEQDTGAKVELELREGGSRRQLIPDEPYDPPCADFDVLAALETELEHRPDDEELRLLVELMKQQETGDHD